MHWTRLKRREVDRCEQSQSCSVSGLCKTFLFFNNFLLAEATEKIRSHAGLVTLQFVGPSLKILFRTILIIRNHVEFFSLDKCNRFLLSIKSKKYFWCLKDFSVSVNIQVIMKDIIFGLVAPCSAPIKNIWQGTLLMKTKRIVMANWSLVTAIGKRRIYKEFFSSLVQRERMRSVNEEPQTCS